MPGTLEPLKLSRQRGGGWRGFLMAARARAWESARNDLCAEFAAGIKKAME